MPLLCALTYGLPVQCAAHAQGNRMFRFFPLSLYSGGGLGWGFFAFHGEHAIALTSRVRWSISEYNANRWTQLLQPPLHIIH
jgi:hypothetical protein